MLEGGGGELPSWFNQEDILLIGWIWGDGVPRGLDF